MAFSFESSLVCVPSRALLFLSFVKVFVKYSSCFGEKHFHGGERDGFGKFREQQRGGFSKFGGDQGDGSSESLGDHCRSGSLRPVRQKSVTRTKATKTVKLVAASGSLIHVEGDAKLEFI